MEHNFGKASLRKLETCHGDLQLLFRTVGKRFPCTILEGHRTEERQNELFEQRKSKLKWPQGKHNRKPSLAVDVAPDPINWSADPKNMARFYHFAGYVMAIANTMGYKLRWGGDWDGDRDFSDQTFDDLVHFELVE